MIVFTKLDDILAMDFSQMRAKSCVLGMAATDEAMKSFVESFDAFFEQFPKVKVKPEREHLEAYLHYMNRITQKINESEVSYYQKKYTEMGISPSDVALMAEGNSLPSFKKIPTRMQFWAARGEFGDTIYNPEQHKKIVHRLDIWSSWLDQLTASADSDSDSELDELDRAQAASDASSESEFEEDRTGIDASPIAPSSSPSSFFEPRKRKRSDTPESEHDSEEVSSSDNESAEEYGVGL